LPISTVPVVIFTEPVYQPAATPSLTAASPIVAQPTFVWVDPTLPPAFLQALVLPAELARWPGGETDPPPGVSLRLEVGSQRPVSHWVYALVAPFPTAIQGVSSQDLQAAWKGTGEGPFAGQPLLMEESTYHNLSAYWGEPGGQAVEVLPSDQLLSTAWERRQAWAIVPFENLEPRWKVLEVDGESPLHKGFDPATYPLTLPISLNGDPALIDTLYARYAASSQYLLSPSTNRDPSRLTEVAMTGVTALVRATAHTMEKRGILYPGRDVRDWLRQADITHISNEVPFAKKCPFPDPFQADMHFCSDERYIELLEDVGTDIIELTGDHFQDYGEAAMEFTLELYDQRGWPYYGGGANLEQARQPLTLEHNGNRLAFIGCNAKGGAYAQAGPNHPGAVKCDLDYMSEQVARLRSQGYLPVVTFQHFEYYTYQAQPDQERDFRRMAQAGAVIVSGSQAHQPQALEFESGALIHYGLGNLFFDQYGVSQATRQAFIDRHYFYNGRYISTELLPILFVDYARPRLMTTAEAEELFRKVFKASGWT
jgi:poly-gamma-glutamate synthesis protein (capsule biosynthesis protein)